MDSKEFLDSLIGKNVKIIFKDTGECFFGELAWNESDSIGLHYGAKIGNSWLNERFVLYFKGSIKSIESAEKSK